MANKPKRRKNGTFEYQYQSLELDDAGQRKRASFYMPPEIRTVRQAEEFASRIQHIVDRLWLGSEIDTAVTNWLSKLDGDLYERFVRKGLAPPKAKPESEEEPAQDRRWRLREWADHFIDGHGGTADTRSNLKLYARGLYRFLELKGHGDIFLDQFTHRNAKEFATWLRKYGSEAKEYKSGLSLTTVRTRLRKLKGIFTAAIDDRKLSENPFDGISTAEPKKSESDFNWVPADSVERLIKASEDEGLRVMLALARYGGLRRHELSIQRWEHFDLVNRRMHILSTKTGVPLTPECADNEGRKILIRRDVPIFEELLPHLLRHREMTSGCGLLQSTYPRDMNLTKRIEACAARAKVVLWSDFWQSMRSTRQSELERQGFQIKAACNWLGNSPRVAEKHYLMAMQQEFDRAVNGPSVIPGQSAPQIVPQTSLDMGRQAETQRNPVAENTGKVGICLVVSQDALSQNYPARTRT
ncbi:site-specific integrase [Aporhodopirellula aestuarii]|uniref:Site-specific integrase n=1 Tax=Aporhodopirellula aestuarii TaxID=2950107 RepID=A0ABT0U4M7_9BACT|nr:site-specific integrase [Aporhodopirellula aestuarii]MCM2371853.1 site-specific integrase [Aporhodopirellula aestuarii]